MTDLNSRPYNPNPAACCEACAFGRGDHAEFCEWADVHTVTDELLEECGVEPQKNWKRDIPMRWWTFPKSWGLPEALREAA